MPSAYCTECDWERRVDEEATAALDLAMIDHYVETGHSPIERRDLEGHRTDLEAEVERRSGTGRVDRDADGGPDCESECE